MTSSAVLTALAIAPMAETGTTGTLDEVVLAAGHLWPLWLLVPACVGAFAWATHRRRKAARALGDPELVRRLTASVASTRRFLSALFVTLSVVFVAGALMRPQYGGTAKVVPASGLDVILVIDYSKSMLAKDVYPSRSERLEAELSRFLEDADRRGDRVGVVVFAGQPRGFPLTRDTRMLDLYLERADPRTENPGGTAIGKALNLALTFLIDARRGEEEAIGPQEGSPTPVEPAQGQEIPPAENDQAIILLTDGEDTETRPLEVAQKAAQLGVRIYTVGIGSRSGEPIQKFDESGEPVGFVTDEEGNYVMTRLAEDVLREVAEVTDGRYIKVDSDAFGLDEVRDMLEDLSRTQREDTIEIHRDEGYSFLVIPALLLLALSMALPERRRRSQ